MLAFDDGERYLMASGDGLSDAFVEGIEDGLGMNEAVGGVVFTDEDAAV